WVEHGDGDAVHVLTRRHAGLVLGTARRALSGSQCLAEEAAQAVFTVMAAKAASLRSHPALHLWLHRAALLEACALRRREARRHRLMASLAAESDVMNPPPPLSPSHLRHRILTELDEALEHLPESDRHLLILRYYEGHSFRDIGTRLCKADDTVQKQASRALEKLSCLLRRRGVAVPASALGMMLNAEALSPGVSAANVSQFAGSAVTGAPHLGLAAKSWHSLQFMLHGKSTTWAAAAAALLLLALSAGSGFHTGAAAEAARQLAGTASDRQAAAALTKPGSARFSAGASRTGPPPPGGAVRGRPPLLDILQAASTIQMDLNGGWSMYSEDMYPNLGHYSSGDTESAITLLGEFRGNTDKFESVSGLIFSAMADEDWRAARERIMKPDALRPDGKLSGQAVRAVAESWGRENPEAAFRWANGLIDSGRTPFDPARGVGETLLADWLARDERGAVAEMERRLESQTALVGKAVEKSITDRPQWWLDRLSPGVDPATRTATLRLARGSLVMLPPAERASSIAAWVRDPALADELLQPAP
ncbi:MAG: sigma-70 family RNA polymerase sigma factor, partial [Verrucomicrobiaceae bacterium]